MRIVILSDPVDNQTAGVHVFTKNLIKHLLINDKKNEYIFIHSKENPFFKGTKNIIIPNKKHIPLYGTYKKFYKIPKLIKKLKPHIVIETAHIGPFNIPKNILRVTVIHDLTPITMPKFHILNSVIMHKLFMKNIIKKSNLILVPSKTTKSDILKTYNCKTKITVIYPGIEKPETTNQEPASKPNSQKNSYPPYILYLGTIEPRKNLNLLIQAFTELKKEKHIPHKLIIAGQIGWKSKNTIKLANSHKDILLTGYLKEKDKAKYLKNANLFIYPSLYEGFGLPPLEAMSHGIPVICSNRGSLKEIFQNYSFMFDPSNKNELKKAIIKIINTPALMKRMSKKGLSYSKKFNWNLSATKTINALKKIQKQ